MHSKNMPFRFLTLISENLLTKLQTTKILDIFFVLLINKVEVNGEVFLVPSLLLIQ